jgi:hypothetical protein
MQNFISYHATGSGVNECRYALLKYLSVYNLKPPADIGVVIFTDTPGVFDLFAPYFQRFEIRETFDSDILKNYQQLLKSYSGNFLFLDTGSYPVKPLESVFYAISNGTIYSIPVEKPQIQSWLKQVQEKPVAFRGTRTQFSENLRYWKAEVLGLMNHHVHIVDDAIELSPVLEQSGAQKEASSLALSYMLQDQTVASLADSLVNYNNLVEIRELLDIFFTKNQEESIPNLVKLVQHIDAVKIRSHKVQYERQPFYKKWMDKLRGNSWSIRQYEKKF